LPQKRGPTEYFNLIEIVVAKSHPKAFPNGPLGLPKIRSQFGKWALITT